MAKNEGVNRSRAIRDFFKKNKKATTQEVIDGLKKQGITVTSHLVTNVKSKVKQRRGAAKTMVAEPETVETKPEVSKSDAIRGYLREHPTASSKEVSEGLAAQGITASTSLIAMVKGKGKRRRRKVMGVVAAVAPTGIGVPEIKAGLSFIKSVGSMDAAKQALAAAVEIKKIV